MCFNFISAQDNSVQLLKALNDYARAIEFDTGTTTIKFSSTGVLQEIIDILKDNPTANFTIEAHSDSMGNDSLNLRLTENRANAVRDFLIENGIASPRLSAKGFGGSRPIASNKTSNGRKQNRRIAFDLSEYKSFSGTVTDQEGYPLPGANIVVKGTANGTQADFDGNFMIHRIKAGDVIVVSFIGNISKEIEYRGQSSLGISLDHQDPLLEEVVVVGYGSGQTKQDPDDAPQFPIWPPPLPSTKAVIPGIAFTNCKTLGDINDKLVDALSVNGYDDRAYFLLPAKHKNGFAIATQCEQTDKNGLALKDPDRWDHHIYFNRDTFLNIIVNNLLPNYGYFRVLVFIITDKPLVVSKKKVHRRTAMSWLDDGAIGFPDKLSDIKYTDKHNVIALVYEFELNENAKVGKLIKPGRHSGKAHLTKAKIWTALLKQ